jgi:hypothetical protein
VIQHPDHRVSDGSRLTTRSCRVPQPSHTSWFPAPPSNGLAWCSAILLQCVRSCARLPHSLAANLIWNLIPAPGRSLTSSRSLRSSFHRPSSEEGFQSGGSGSPPSHERNTYRVSNGLPPGIHSAVLSQQGALRRATLPRRHSERARHSHHILWAMIANSSALGSRVVSAIVSSLSFLRLVPCPWVASSMSF